MSMSICKKKLIGGVKSGSSSYVLQLQVQVSALLLPCMQRPVLSEWK